MNNFFKFVVAVAVVGVLGGAGYFVWRNLNAPKPAACTLEARICPDGSYVGRTMPDCEFAACPTEALCEGGTCPITGGEENLKTFSDSATGVSFQYPESLKTQYISLVGWPPMAAVDNTPFACIEGGSEIASAGVTAKVAINGRDYCVTKESEGAAGSVYTQYAYAFPADLVGLALGADKTIILTFSLRFVQCGNYPNLQMAACNDERAFFNPDPIIDRIARSLRVSEDSGNLIND